MALTLLRSCSGVWRVNYLLRIALLRCTASGALAFDRMMEDSTRTLLGGVLLRATFREIQLTVRSEVPTFGIGLTSAAETAAAAYLASLALVCKLLTSYLPSQPETALKTNHQLWSSRCLPNDVVAL